MTLLDTLTAIDPSKKCLEFLAKRIASGKYRGIQISEHNRYDKDFIITLLREMYELVANKKMVIRTTDLKKRPVNLPEERVYAQYVSNINAKLGRSTQDSVRKNLFVDMHRMGLIVRYDTAGNPTDPYKQQNVKYVSLSKLGIDLIKAENLFKTNLIYTRAIDVLSFGLADELLDINELDNKITQNEFQFFFSYINQELNGHLYTKTELIDYIKEFRSMSRAQKELAISTVKNYCDPKNFAGNKTDKRDYHNWINETQQIFMLMGQTVYFEQRDESLFLRVGKDALYEDTAKLNRSLQEKHNYFTNHHLKRQLGYELHHIVPLCWANDRNEFALLDVWQNMIYIDGFNHSKITQAKNQYVVLNFIDKDIQFSYLDGKANLYCRHMQDVLYNIKNQTIMKDYNTKLLNAK